MTADTVAGRGKRLTPGAQRILDVASELFYWRGIHAVGVDTIAAESGVTKRTLYDQFGSKDGLIVAYLQARDRRWRALITSRLDAEHSDPVHRALVPFDVLFDWLAPSTRGCSFVNAFAELPEPEHPGRQAVVAEKKWLRGLFRELLADSWPYGVETAIDVTLLGRYYERFADHAVSVARRVVYLVTGEREMHASAD